MAQSAIDHRPVHPILLDLRDADFEIGAEDGGDVDNPAVPNMVDLGLSPWTAGILFPSGEMYYVAESPDFATLPIEFRDEQEHERGGLRPGPSDAGLGAVGSGPRTSGS